MHFLGWKQAWLGRLFSCFVGRNQNSFRSRRPDQFNLTPRYSIKDPITSSCKIAAEIVTPSPLCCCLFLLCVCLTFTIHPRVHQSGSSSVTLLSSVKNYFEKFCFMFFKVQFSLNFLCFVDKNGMLYNFLPQQIF